MVDSSPLMLDPKGARTKAEQSWIFTFFLIPPPLFNEKEKSLITIFVVILTRWKPFFFYYYIQSKVCYIELMCVLRTCNTSYMVIRMREIDDQ